MGALSGRPAHGPPGGPRHGPPGPHRLSGEGHVHRPLSARFPHPRGVCAGAHRL